MKKTKDLKIDLHVHTVYSDGTLTTDEVMRRAAEKGLTHVAITDHDVASSPGITNWYGVKLISGIEMTTRYNGEVVHVLGYFKKNAVPQTILEYSSHVKHERKAAVDRWLYKVENTEDSKYGRLIVDRKLLYKHGGNVHFGNIVRMLEQCNPHLDRQTIEKITDSYDKEIPLISTRDAIDTLHENNAIAVLAHPILLKKDGKFNRDLFENLMCLSFDGVEAIYPEHSEYDEEFFSARAIWDSKLICGGSDFHADYWHPADIGDKVLTGSAAKRFLESIEEEY